ncbi:hypothetical protein L0244_20455 [bacterium]|nr:hypothetical protein [bacterium]
MSTEENAKQNAQSDQGMKIVKLVRALNEFGGLNATVNTGSIRSRAVTLKNREWSICVEIAQSEDGWFLLEFLAWLINNDFQQAGMDVRFIPYSRPPYLHIPGRNLMFVVEGVCPPDQVAVAIQRARKECYVPPERLQDFILDSYGPGCLEEYLKENKSRQKKQNIAGAKVSVQYQDPTLNALNLKNLPSGVIRFDR